MCEVSLVNEDLRNAAVEYATRGWLLFPLPPKGKSPISTNRTFKTAVNDPEAIGEFWDRNPECNIGVATGEISGIVVIDIDPRHGGDIDDLRALGTLPNTVESITGGGGTHLYFKYPMGRNICCSTNVMPGIDVRGNGGYAVIPPSKTTGDYQWELSNPSDLAEMPEWLINLIEKPQQAEIEMPMAEALTAEDIKRNLEYISDNLPRLKYKTDDYWDWLRLGMAIHHATGGSADGFDKWNRISAHSAKYDPSKIAKKWQSYSTGKGLGMGSIVYWVKNSPIADAAADADPADADPVVDERAITFQLAMDQLPKPIAIIASYLADVTANKVNIVHIMLAAAILGGAIGKRAEIRNRANDYYLNLVMAVLMDSGFNKTGLFNATNTLTVNFKRKWEPLAITLQSFLDRTCTVIHYKKDRSYEERDKLIAEQKEKDKTVIDGNFILINEFRSFMLSVLPDRDIIQNGQTLCQLFDRSSCDCSTIGNGIRINGDCCYSVLGFSQSDLWNSEIRTAKLQKGGLAGRIIPVNESQFDIEPLEPLPVTFNDALAAVTAVRDIANYTFAANTDKEPLDFYAPMSSGGSAYVQPKIKIIFGNEKNDGLTNAKKNFAKTKIVGNEIVNGEHEWKLLESKVLMQSAKVAAIFALASLTEKKAIVDAQPFIGIAYRLVGGSHLGNLRHVEHITEESIVTDKIKRHLRTYHNLTATELGRFCNMKPFILTTYLKTMLQSGEIEQMAGKKRGVIKYRLQA